MRLLVVLVFAFALQQALPVSAQSGSVVVGGKEWLQPADFVNLSYNDIAAVCPPPDGICDGQLNSITVTGFRWAAVADVNELFNAYLGDTDTPLTSEPGVTTCAPGTCVADMLQDFAPTLETVEPAYGEVGGWSVTPFLTGAYTPYAFSEADGDEFNSDNYTGLNVSASFFGAWLFRDAPVPPPPPPPPAANTQPIPTQGTLATLLMIIGLLSLAALQLAGRGR
jgi:hypothetical protein